MDVFVTASTIQKVSAPGCCIKSNKDAPLNRKLCWLSGLSLGLSSWPFRLEAAFSGFPLRNSNVVSKFGSKVMLHVHVHVVEQCFPNCFSGDSFFKKWHTITTQSTINLINKVHLCINKCSWLFLLPFLYHLVLSWCFIYIYNLYLCFYSFFFFLLY